MVDTYDNFSTIELRLPLDSSLSLSLNKMTAVEFYNFCQANPELRIERNAHGAILIMPPTTSETGRQNSKLHILLGIWNLQSKLGETFDSSTGFKLPNGAERSPDTAWITTARWNALSKKEQRQYAPIVPDFVLELRSQDQSLTELRKKMEEYIDCGCRLAWLIDVQNRRTYVYAEQGDIQTLPFEESLIGDPVLPGFTLRLADILD